MESGNDLRDSARPFSTQRHGDAEAQRSIPMFFCVARFWPSSDGQIPLGRSTAPKTSFRPGFPAQRPALFERRPRLFSSSFNGWNEPTLQHNKRKARQNPRAAGTSAGEKNGGDERLRSEQTGFSPAAGDYRSPVVLPSFLASHQKFSHRPFATLRCLLGWVGGLCVSAALRGWEGGWLCVFFG